MRLALWMLCVWAPTTWAQGQLAIIIDDVGYNLRLGQRSADLPGAFTLAVLPFTPHGRILAERAHQRGKEIMLHVPMSNEHNYTLGPGALTTAMQRPEFLSVLRQGLAQVPHVQGVNNHMGSLLTQRTEPMGWLMEELKSRGLYFVDSRTTAKTQALLMAERVQLPSRRRDIFLDDSRKPEHIQRQLVLALEKAQSQGSAIAIGHPYPQTLQALEAIQPWLTRYRVELVSVSRLMRARGFDEQVRGFDGQVHGFDEQARGYCLAPPMSLWPSPFHPQDPFTLDTVLNPFAPTP